MPLSLRPRIRCFYCGSRSGHVQGEKISNFVCKVCEGTNYFDQNGNIADVPHDIHDIPRNDTTRFATAPDPNTSPLSRPDATQDPLFCAQCLKNQRFLADCLANYLPAESDPRYDQFESEYPQYKRDLEKRYPQVCSRCEPRVRARLKKSAYVAKANILSKNLNKSGSYFGADGAQHVHLVVWQHLRIVCLLVAEVGWWISLVLQGSWHLLGAVNKLGHPRRQPLLDVGLHPAMLTYCMRSIIKASELHSHCLEEFSAAVRLAMILGVVVFWWNPSLRRERSTRTTNQHTFYLVQALVLVTRFFAWDLTKDSSDIWNERALRATHAFTLVILILTSVVSYRIIKPAPRPKLLFRNLDAPLVDADSVQYPQDNFQSRGADNMQSSRFLLSNLAATDTASTISDATRGYYSLITPVSNTGVQPTEQHSIGGDDMDWEPSQAHLTHNLHSRWRGMTPNPGPKYPVSSAFSAFPTQAGPSPFHGSLPAAPRSLEARLRTAAQKQPAQFKPASDSKQADWFKRMHLAQSSSSWANKDYIKTISDPNKGRLELQEGKLHFGGSGPSGSGGTGLEDIFGNNFRLGGDSPVKEDAPPRPVERQGLGIAETVFATMVVLAVASIGLKLLLPATADTVVHWTAPWMQKGREMAYGE